MKVAAIFDLAVGHSYYADGICPDFALEPTSDTERLLRNHRCILKPRRDGLSTLAELNDNGDPAIAVDTAAKFRFNMRLRSDDFPLFTNLAAIHKLTAPRYAPGAADVSKGDPLTLSAEDAPPGKDAPPGNGIFAVIEIPGAVFASPKKSWPVRLRVNFEPKRARWIYYCVTDMNLAGRDLQLVEQADTGTPQPVLAFSAANRTDLRQSPDAGDAVATQLASRYPDWARIRFVSDDVVACRQSPRRLSLQLGGNDFPDVLPMPPLRNCALLPASVQGNQTQQDALFQVVKYVSYSFSKNGV
jgi:hypothetical protein